MSIRKRLLLYAILFAAASLTALLFAAHPLGPDYSLRALGSVRLAGSAEGESLGFPDNWVMRTDERLKTPVSIRQGETLGIISDRSVVSVPRHGYSTLGEGLLATGDPAADPPAGSLVITADGGVFEVERAERIWSGGERILAFADGGRRVADISDAITVSGREYTDDEPLVMAIDPHGEQDSNGREDRRESHNNVREHESSARSSISPEWFMLPAPVTAASSFGQTAATGDALGGITLLSAGAPHELDEGFERLEPFEPEAHGSILSLAFGPSGEDEEASTLFAVGGYEPSQLLRIEISADSGFGRRSSIDLPGSVNRPVHLRVSGEHVLLAAGGSLLVYDRDLEPVAQRSFDAAVRETGFLADGRLVFAYTEDQELFEVDVFYVDDLDVMYSLTFPRSLDSIRTAGDTLVAADRRQTLFYGEDFR